MTKIQKYALLSLLIIPGILICGLSHGTLPLLVIGGIITFIGGFSFGRLLSLTL